MGNEVQYVAMYGTHRRALGAEFVEVEKVKNKLSSGGACL